MPRAQQTSSRAAQRLSPRTNQRGHASSSDDQGFFKEHGYGTHEGKPSPTTGRASQRGHENGAQWRGYGRQHDAVGAGPDEPGDETVLDAADAENLAARDGRRNLNARKAESGRAHRRH